MVLILSLHPSILPPSLLVHQGHLFFVRWKLSESLFPLHFLLEFNHSPQNNVRIHSGKSSKDLGSSLFLAASHTTFRRKRAMRAGPQRPHLTQEGSSSPPQPWPQLPTTCQAQTAIFPCLPGSEGGQCSWEKLIWITILLFACRKEVKKNAVLIYTGMNKNCLWDSTFHILHHKD